MTSLNILNLVLFILMTNTQAKLINRKNEIKVGDELDKNDATVVQDENQMVRPRRSLVSPKTIPGCYKQFVAGNQPPSGFRLDHTNIMYICQQVPDDPTKTFFYSTMFDVGYGIPIYSAYVVSKADASKIGTITRKDLGAEKWRQEAASDLTYDPQKTYDKGHLLPAQTYSFTKPHILSTFTYTNAVPQVSGFNTGQWRQYENKIREYATSECSPKGGDLYLITGISEVNLQQKAGKLEAIQKIPLQDLGAKTAPKVSIPRSMWTAGCCIVSSVGAVGSFAVIGNNLKTTKVESLKMTELQDFLLIGVHGFGGTDIKLFPANPKCSDPVKNVNLNKRKAT
ncbi:hypothetical protein P5673_030882 [Acropora cervicornis]|uniref:Uncharacterized protein n=1 Tax=Acropora cervicornis TaxID=6130 RepID=A0AAD9USY0_ACRCE|nr:hypothetical protein P5673_030882 [Acropora cervicornis]